MLPAVASTSFEPGSSFKFLKNKSVGKDLVTVDEEDLNESVESNVDDEVDDPNFDPSQMVFATQTKKTTRRSSLTKEMEIALPCCASDVGANDGHPIVTIPTSYDIIKDKVAKVMVQRLPLPPELAHLSDGPVTVPARGSPAKLPDIDAIVNRRWSSHPNSDEDFVSEKPVKKVNKLSRKRRSDNESLVEASIRISKELGILDIEDSKIGNSANGSKATKSKRLGKGNMSVNAADKDGGNNSDGNVTPDDASYIPPVPVSKKKGEAKAVKKDGTIFLDPEEFKRASAFVYKAKPAVEPYKFETPWFDRDYVDKEYDPDAPKMRSLIGSPLYQEWLKSAMNEPEAEQYAYGGIARTYGVPDYIFNLNNIKSKEFKHHRYVSLNYLLIVDLCLSLGQLR